MVRVKKAKKSDNGKPKKSDIAKELDKYWSIVVKQRDGHECQVEGCTKNNVNAHHIFSRKNHSTRWDVSNGISLCFYHHMRWAHVEYEQFRDFVINWMGKKPFEALKERAGRIEKYTIADLLNIKEKLKRMVDR